MPNEFQEAQVSRGGAQLVRDGLIKPDEAERRDQQMPLREPERPIRIIRIPDPLWR